ncbi:hypothetical protein ACLQ3A_18225 [Micromonospora zamorensis]|uniref:hypothetical protein n=1 Tax=Micromonospora zamorensis TaxID=709883 RepID=UPI003CF3C908
MEVLADCPEWFTLAGLGVFVYQNEPVRSPSGTVLDGNNSGSRVIDSQVYDLARQTRPPAGVALIIPDQPSESLRAYLHDLVAADGQLVVVPFSSRTFGLLDLTGAVRLQDRLGIVMGVPGTAVGEGAPTVPEGRLVPIESADKLGTTGRAATAYRLLPDALVANRQKLGELTTGTQPPSVAKLASYSATGGSPTAGGDGFVAGDLTPLAGVYYATFGDLPQLPLAELLASTSPLSRTGLNAALGWEPRPMPLANVLQEFKSGRASAALVHASSESRTAGSLWMVMDHAGRLGWANGTQPVASVVLDGAVDERAASLEDPHSEFVLVGPEGLPYGPELPPEPTWTPRLSANARRRGDTILLGPDGPYAATKEIMAKLASHDGPVVLVNVRRGVRSKHGSTLDELTANSLHHVLEKNPAISVVVATEDNDQLKSIVVNQHGRSSVQPTMLGFERFWAVEGPRSSYPEQYQSLTGGALARAVALADKPKAGPSDLVAGLINQPTWKGVESYLEQHSSELLTREVLRELTHLVSVSAANGERPSRFGVGQVKDHPFYRPNLTLEAHRALIEQGLRAKEDPELGGERPLEPQHASLMDAIEPHTQTADPSLFLGYLTSRPLDAARLGQPVGDYVTGLLWLRELLQATRNPEVTKVHLADVLAVVRAKGELEGERAARRPGQPEIFRAHAAMVAVIADFERVGRAPAGWRERLKATDCLTGTDRVFWHFMISNVFVPMFPEGKAELRSIREFMAACHDKAGV